MATDSRAILAVLAPAHWKLSLRSRDTRVKLIEVVLGNSLCVCVWGVSVCAHVWVEG